MKKIIILSFLFALMPLSDMATKIDIKTDGMYHQGGARMLSVRRVIADYDEGVVTVHLQNYFGIVQVYIYDAEGIIVGATSTLASGASSITTSIQSLNDGEYTLRIVLTNNSYSGTFDVIK